MYFRKSILLSCTALLGVMPSALLAQGPAQPAAAEDAVGTDLPGDIVVTAQGRAQRLRDVPVSVLAATGPALQKQAITSLETFAIRQPGFRISQSPASDYVAIRGIGSSANIGFEQSVGTFVDGLYRGRARDIRMALFDVERIEVLRGPQTTFFGNNTIGGALNIVTRKPGRDLGVDGTLSWSPTYGEYSLEAGADLPVSEDLRFRVAVRQSGSEGYVRNSNTGRKGPRLDDTVGRLAMAWTPSSTVSIDARLDAGRMRDKGVFNVELLDCPPPAPFSAAGACSRSLAANGGTTDSRLDRRSAANPSYFDYDFVEGEVAARIAIGTHMLSFTTGYFSRDYDLLNDPVPVAAAKGGSTVGTSTALPIALGEDYDQFSQEIRLASPDSGPISYIAGLYYQHGKLDDALYQGFYFAPVAAAARGAIPATTPVAGLISVRERSNSYSGFGAVTLRPVDRLRLNLAARYTRVDKRDRRTATIGTAGSIPGKDNFTAFTPAVQALLYGPTGIDAGDYVDPRRSDSAFLPSASVQYDLTPTAMLYASYAKGFKAGGSSIGTTKSAFEPERVDSFEAGLKASLLDRAVDINLALFHSKYRNLQETATVLVGATSRQVVTNAAESLADGVELGLALHPAPDLTLSTNLTWLDARYRNYANAPCTTLQQAAAGAGACTQDLSGTQRAFAPRWSGNAGIDYSRPIGGGMRISGNVTGYFSSRYFVVPTGDRRLSQSGFAKIDARLGFGPEDEAWEVAVIGRNLTDRTTASYRQVVPGAAGSIGALAEPPRSIAFQARFRFR